MKALYLVAAAGLGLMASLGSVSAQYGGYEPGYRDRDRDDGYRGRDRYRDRDDDYRDRRRDDRDSYTGFDEREYLRCNPDVRRAVANGQMQSGAAHYRVFGRRERRRLTC